MVPIYKREHDADWFLVFHHNSAGGYFSPSDELFSSTEHKYSRLGKLEKYRIHGEFEFLLEYPELKGYNRFKQTSNPTKFSTVSDFSIVNLSWKKYGFAGLAISTSKDWTFIDGSPNDNDWFYAIASRKKWIHGDIPGPVYSDEGNPPIHEVNLWVRVPSFFSPMSCKKSNLHVSLFSLVFLCYSS